GIQTTGKRSSFSRSRRCRASRRSVLILRTTIARIFPASGPLYSVAAALLAPEARNLDGILRQLNQFGYDLDRLQFVAQDEVELLGRVRADYDEFIRVGTRGVELSRSGRAAEGRELQMAQATPLADRLERLTNQLVNQAEA